MLEQAFAPHEKPGALYHRTHLMEPIVQILASLGGMCDSSRVAWRSCSLALSEKTFLRRSAAVDCLNLATTSYELF
jgi:hypothetical protein